MGRKFTLDKPKPGPGRKARKQGIPEFSGFIDINEGQAKGLSRRQRVRAKKREWKEEKEAEKKAKKLKLNENKTNKKTNGQIKSKLKAEKIEKKTSDSEDDDGFSLMKKKLLKNGKIPKHRDKAEEEEDSDDSFEEDGANSEDELESYDEETSDDDEKEDKSDSSDEDKSDVSDEDEDQSDMSDEDEDKSDESDEELDAFERLEKQSRKLEKEKRRVEAESQEEMLESAKKVDIEIPTLEEVQKELEDNPHLPSISLRIKDIIFILADLKERREEGRSRSEYLSILEHDLCAYYSYNPFLIKKLMGIFTLSELVDFLEANEVPRPLTIRTNTLKTRRKQLAQSLINQGVNLDMISWSKVGLVIYNSGSISLGATPQYMCGQYILQGASSFLPVVALGPRENEKVLDMCAAPGGKSTHIAAMMRNTGVLFCNDAHLGRTKALVGNFHRMGITNTIITNLDGRNFPKLMSHYFDRVLLDAPCTGTGVISKDDRVKLNKGEKDLKRCSHVQKELILAAIDCVDARSPTGGYICYSTCSILCEENEEVINFALKKRNVKVVPTGLEIGTEGRVKYMGTKLHPSIKLCKRIYPHVNNMDGFFVARLKKTSNDIPIPKSKLT